MLWFQLLSRDQSPNPPHPPQFHYRLLPTRFLFVAPAFQVILRPISATLAGEAQIDLLFISTGLKFRSE